jgi:hypothetical protein
LIGNRFARLGGQRERQEKQHNDREQARKHSGIRGGEVLSILAESQALDLITFGSRRCTKSSPAGVTTDRAQSRPGRDFVRMAFLEGGVRTALAILA